jgi:SAM-dependent methyltransferase
MAFRKQLYRGYAKLRRRVLGIAEPGQVNFGDLRRLGPISRDFGSDRGLPIDRYYIEAFLAAHAADIQGRVLEIGDNLYTLRFGAEKVSRSDVLHVKDGNPKATIVGDLTDIPAIPDQAYDCIVFTQTLLLIYDIHAAIRTLHRILKPGGVLLFTVPGITRVPNGTEWGSSWYWSFTHMSVERMLGEAFGPSRLSVGVSGNILAACAVLHGLATQELTPDELDAIDPDYPVIVTARAVKA